MAVESSVSQDFEGRNREGAEPKKKLKKTRSIRLSKGPSLKPSSRRSKSRFSWLSSVDLSSDTSSVVDFSDSAPNYMKASNSSDPKKESFQGGSEIDDATSVGSASYESLVNGLPALSQASRIQKMLKNHGTSRSFRRRTKSRSLQPSILPSNDSSTPLHPSSAELSDGSPNYLKSTSSSAGRKVMSQASTRNSSISDSSDQSSSNLFTSKSVSGSQKSSQTLARTSSMKSVRVIMKKTSFKPRRPVVNYSKISDDVNVHRATCSSTFKDKKFPESTELHSDQTEAEKISIMRVCPYQHCSLHGHSRGPAPPPMRALHKKRQSLNSQKTMKTESKSKSGINSSGCSKKELPASQISSKVEPSRQNEGISSAAATLVKGDKELSISIEIHAKLKAQVSGKADGENKAAEAVEISLAHHENLNQMISLLKTISDLKEKSDGCCCQTEAQKSSSASAEVDTEVQEVSESYIADEDQDSTIGEGNCDRSFANSPDLHINPLDELQKCKQLGSARNLEDVIVATEDKCSISTASNDNSLEQQKTSTGQANQNEDEHKKTSTGETNQNKDSADVIGAGLVQVGDTEAEISTLVGDSEPNTSPRKEFQAKFNKEKHISMWHMIHQQMISGLTSDMEAKPLHIADAKMQEAGPHALPASMKSADEEKQVDEDTKSEDSKDTVDQDIELRKVFAIKLVREAIEKILLPEIPDQSSDDQSITSDSMSDEDISEKNKNEDCAKDGKRESDDGKGEDNALVDTKEVGENSGVIHGIEKEKTESKLENRSEKKAPKHWSNLKKWIILQRFIKALEKVRKFNPRGPRHLQLEPDSEGEKVSLRHQSVEEKKRAEEWMLDYALRQAVSQLAPTQKKKVAMLVKAFETVVPPQDDSNIPMAFAKLKEAGDESPSMGKKSISGVNDTIQEEIHSPVPYNSETTDACASLVEYSQPFGDVCSKSNAIRCFSPEELPGNEKPKKDILKETALSQEAKYDAGDGKPGQLSSKVKAQGGNIEKSPSNFSSDNSTFYGDTVVPQGTEVEKKVGEAGLLEGLPLIDPKSNANDNEEDKKSRIRMWHMVYQHVVCSIAEKVGPKLLDGTDDEEAGGANELSEFSKPNQDAGDEKYQTALRSGFSRSEAVKLVQEAVDEILLPEIQDDSSDTQSVTSDTVTDQEISEKNQIEGKLNNLSSPEGIKDGIRETEKSVVTELDQAKHESTVEKVITQEERAELLVQTKSEPPKPKNWSKLKKLILLKRSIKALEKARKVKPQPQTITPLIADSESEKVNLINQMADERNKAEQWMLDYAVQHIVNKLTPARKRRVAMLVEAFEAVVPLPEV